jgi:hypothetical protein
MATVRLCVLFLFLEALRAQDARSVLRSYAEHSRHHLRDFAYDQEVELRSLAADGSVEAVTTRRIHVSLENGRRMARVFDESGKQVDDTQKKVTIRTPPGWPAVNAIDCPSGKEVYSLGPPSLEGTEEVEGRPAWILTGGSVRGRIRSTWKLWIDQQDLECAKFQSELESRISSLIGKFRLRRTIQLDQAKAEDGTWLPSEGKMELEENVPAIARWHMQWTTRFTQFQRVHEDSKILKPEDSDLLH